MGLMGDYHCDIDELPVIYMIHFFFAFLKLLRVIL